MAIWGYGMTKELLQSLVGQLSILDNSVIIVIVKSGSTGNIIGQVIRSELRVNHHIDDKPNSPSYPPSIEFWNNTNRVMVIDLNHLRAGFKLSSLGVDPDQYPIWHLKYITPQLENLTCWEIDTGLYAREFIRKYDEENELLKIY